MIIGLCDIPSEGLTLSGDEAPASLGFSEGELVFSEPIHLEIRLLKYGEKEVLISGSLSSKLTLECSRCLEAFSEGVCAHVSANYTPEPVKETQQELELFNQDLESYFYQGQALSIDDLVKTHIHLAIPMYPLCHKDCQGLCTHCGVNLNQAECTHPTDKEMCRELSLSALIHHQSPFFDRSHRAKSKA